MNNYGLSFESNIDSFIDSTLTFQDAFIPTLFYRAISFITGNSLITLVLSTELVILGISYLIYRQSNGVYPLLLLQLNPLVYVITNTVSGLDDFISMYFLALLIIYIDHRTIKPYFHTLMILLSHKASFIIALVYSMFKRRFDISTFSYSLLIASIVLILLDYTNKFNQIIGLQGIIYEPFHIFISGFSQYGYPLILSQLISLYIAYKHTRKTGINKELLLISLIPFILPFNSGDHSLVWRLLWVNIVLIPLCFKWKKPMNNITYKNT